MKLVTVSAAAMSNVRSLKSARVANTSAQSMRRARAVNNTISSRKKARVSGRFQRLQRDLGLLCSAAWASLGAVCASEWFMGFAPNRGGRRKGFQTRFMGRQPAGPGRKVTQEVKHHETDGNAPQQRQEERRVGKECVSQVKTRWPPYHQQNT